jgi:hypothetical protein
VGFSQEQAQLTNHQEIRFHSGLDRKPGSFPTRIGVPISMIFTSGDELYFSGVTQIVDLTHFCDFPCISLLGTDAYKKGFSVKKRWEEEE